MRSAQPEDPATRFCGFEAIPVPVQVLVGRTSCRLSALAELGPGEVVRLDRRVGEPFELRAGEVMLALVEPVAVDDGVAIKLIRIVQEDNGGDAG